MRLILWLIQIVWGGTRWSLLWGILLVLSAILVFTSIVKPYFDTPREMPHSELIDLTAPSGIGQIILENDDIEGSRRALVGEEMGYYGIMEIGRNHLLLIASPIPIDELPEEILGRLDSREIAQMEIFNDLVAEEDLDGTTIPLVFKVGELEQIEVQVGVFLNILLLVLGLIGFGRFIYKQWQRRSTVTATA